MKTKIIKTFFNLCWISMVSILAVSVFSGFIVSPANTSRYSANYADVVLYSSTTDETISYTSKEESYIETVNAVPLYTQESIYPNSCGPVAGTIIVGFYDKYYENLIPNYKSYLASGKYKRNDATIVNVVMSELVTLMRTNVIGAGVSEADCKNGLNTFVKNAGYTLDYMSIKSGKIVNESAFIAAIDNNQPTLLFCDKLDVYSILPSANVDELIYTRINSPHVAVAYGLYTIKYYNNASNFRTDKYLRVATGIDGQNSGFVKLSSTDWCDSAYAVAIS